MSLSKLQPSVSQSPDVGPSPNQPRNISISISFPKVSFGKAKPVLRAFNASWFDKWGWLHWDESERAFCFTCVNAFKEKLKCGTADTAFITRGYQNCKDATIAFREFSLPQASCHCDDYHSSNTWWRWWVPFLNVSSWEAGQPRVLHEAYK